MNHVAARSIRSAAVVACLSVAGCAGGVNNTPAMATIDIDPSQRGPVAGVGIEGQDIISMTDRMMRDMLQSPTLANAARPPQIIIDSEFFINESAQRLNKNAITDRLRVGLNNASQGRMVFVGRNYAGMVAQERDLKRSGTVDVGTSGLTKAQAGGDYRLGGRIVSVDQRNAKTGAIQRYNQVTFEMVDLERGTIVWSGIYEFARAAADDIIYR